MFEINPTKNYGLTNDKLFASNGKIPVVVNSSMDNGIGGYVDLKPTEKGNIITFSDTTTTDSIFYQPNDFVGYSHVQGMKPFNAEKWDKYTLMFVVCAFRHSAKGRFDYGNKFNRKNASNIQTQLPSKDNQPDYEYMATYVKAVQKLVIKGVIDFANREIQAYAQAIH